MTLCRPFSTSVQCLQAIQISFLYIHPLYRLVYIQPHTIIDYMDEQRAINALVNHRRTHGVDDGREAFCPFYELGTYIFFLL